MVTIAIEMMAGGMCQHKVLAVAPSPDGRYRAVIFAGSCGATTDFSTQVPVIRVWWYRGNKSGYLFVADTQHGKAQAGPGGGPLVQLQWLYLATLFIAYNPAARVVKSEPAVADISVTYRLLDDFVFNISPAQ